jgi:hypothetical protein
MEIEKLNRLLDKYPLNRDCRTGVDGKYHYVYLIVFENGFYYIGKHSTTNIDDGYFASGALPIRCRDKGYSYTRFIISYEDSSKSALFLEADILSNGAIYHQDDCLNCYPGSPPSNQGHAVIRKGNKFKMVDRKLLTSYIEKGWEIGPPKRIRMTNFEEDRYVLPVEIAEYEAKGFVIGRVACRGRTFITKNGKYKFIKKADSLKYELDGWEVKHPHEGLKVLRKGRELVKVNPSEVDNLLKNGYSASSTVESLIYIRKNGKFRRVKPFELDEYLNSGWEIGTNILGTVYVNDGEREYRIKPEALDEYICSGCVEGRLNWVWVNNGTESIRLNPNDTVLVLEYLNNGYSIGQKTRTSKRKVTKTGEVRYIVDEKLEQYLSRGWTLLH